MLTCRGYSRSIECSGARSSGSSLGDEAPDELTLTEAFLAIYGHYRRLTEASFQLLVDDDATGFLVMEVALADVYPAPPPRPCGSMARRACTAPT